MAKAKAKSESGNDVDLKQSVIETRKLLLSAITCYHHPDQAVEFTMTDQMLTVGGEPTNASDDDVETDEYEDEDAPSGIRGERVLRELLRIRCRECEKVVDRLAVLESLLESVAAKAKSRA